MSGLLSFWGMVRGGESRRGLNFQQLRGSSVATVARIAVALPIRIAHQAADPVASAPVPVRARMAHTHAVVVVDCVQSHRAGIRPARR